MLCTHTASEVRGSILDWWHAPQPAAVAPGEVNPARLTENYSGDLEQPGLPTGPSVLGRSTSAARANPHVHARTHTYPLHKCVIPTASCLMVYKQTTAGENSLPHHAANLHAQTSAMLWALILVRLLRSKDVFDVFSLKYKYLLACVFLGLYAGTSKLWVNLCTACFRQRPTKMVC